MAESPSVTYGGSEQAPAASWPAQGWHLLRAMRPRQWAKNLLIYLAFFFTLGSHEVAGLGGELALFGWVTLGFLLFSVISGATYIINDLFDVREDRLHPRKRHRPLASGRLRAGFAAPAAVALIAGGVGASFLVNFWFGVVAAIYLVVTLSYNLYLKDRVILDVMAVAAGFVLRAAAGAVVIAVPISPWLYVMTTLGALLISLGKRRNELSNLGANSSAHRPALGEYSTQLLDQLVAVVAPSMLVAYTLYTFTAENLPADHSMMLTIPFVIYGVFRYLFLVHRRNLGGEPEEIFLRDRPLLGNIVLWLAAASLILVLGRT